MKRGAVQKKSSRMINVWIPEHLLPAIDQAVDAQDLDRAKFIRAAIREKLSRHGFQPLTPAN